MASSRPAATAAKSTERSSSSAARSRSSDIDRRLVLDRLDERAHGRVPEEEVERDDGHVGHNSSSPLGETRVGHDDVGVLGDLRDRRVHHLDPGLLELLAQRPGEHDARAHARVARDDELVHGAAVDGGHADSLVVVVDELAVDGLPAESSASVRLPATASSRSPRPKPMRIAATKNETTAATRIDSRTRRWSPRGVIAMYAKMLPGAGDATRPLPSTTLVR